MSNFLSYLFTGLPASASDQARRASNFLSYACIVVLCGILVLAAAPSWPLAFGVAAGFLVLGCIARMVLKSATGDER